MPKIGSDIRAIGSDVRNVATADLLPQLGSLYGLTFPELQQYTGYLNELTSTDPTQREVALAPAVMDTTTQFDTARRNLRSDLPRGGEQDYLLAEADIGQAAETGRLSDQLYAAAQEAKGRLGIEGFTRYLEGLRTFGGLEGTAADVLTGQQDRSASGFQSALDAISNLASDFAQGIDSSNPDTAAVTDALGGTGGGASDAGIASSGLVGGAAGIPAASGIDILPAGTAVGPGVIGAGEAGGLLSAPAATAGVEAIPGGFGSVAPGLDIAGAGASVPAAGASEGATESTAAGGGFSSGLGAVAGGAALGAGLPLGILALMGINPFSDAPSAQQVATDQRIDNPVVQSTVTQWQGWTQTPPKWLTPQLLQQQYSATIGVANAAHLENLIPQVKQTYNNLVKAMAAKYGQQYLSLLAN